MPDALAVPGRLARLKERMEEALSALRVRDRWAWALLVLFSLPYVWLVWSERYLPMQDLPGQIELAYLHHQVRAGDAAFQHLYQISPQPWPNSLTTLVLSTLGGLVGFEAAMKVALSLYVVAWPLSLGWLARRFGRSPAVALLALPSIVDFSWAIGFVNYLIAKPLMVVAIIGATLFTRRPSLARGAGVVGLLLLAFLGHAIAFVFAMAGAAFAIVFFSRGWRRLVNLWPVLVACLIPVRYLRAQSGSSGGPEAWVMYNFDTGLLWAWNHLGDLGSSNGEEWAYVISFALFLVVIALGQHNADPSALDAHGRRSTWFLWLSGFGLFLFYGWGPAHMPNVAIICPRALILAWVLMLLLPLRLPEGWARPAIVLGVAAAVAIHVGSTHAQYAKFNALEMPGFEKLMRMIPPGKALTVHYVRPGTPYAKHNGMWHWPKLYGVWQGGAGRTNDTFAWRSTSFVTLTDEARRAGTFYGGSPGFRAGAIAPWDYYLVHGRIAPGAEAQVASVADPVGTAAEWHLYRVRKPAAKP